MGPLDRPVALLLHLARGDHGGLLFSGGRVHDRARKVGQSADVVKVQMGQHDVSDVIGGVSKRPDLGGRGFAGDAGIKPVVAAAFLIVAAGVLQQVFERDDVRHLVMISAVVLRKRSRSWVVSCEVR